MLTGYLSEEAREEWQKDRAAIIAKIAELTHIWDRFAGQSIGSGVQPLFHLSFEAARSRPGIVLWKSNLECNLGAGTVPEAK